MRTSHPRGVTSRLAQLTTTHHTNNPPASTPFFKNVPTSTSSSSPSAAALGAPKSPRVQQSASFHTNSRQQQTQQRFFPIITTRRSSAINHPLLNFPYRSNNKQPMPILATLAHSTSTTSTSPRMASTSVPRSPSPAAAASTSAAPGSSQPAGSANQVGAAAGSEHVLQREAQQPRQPHQNQSSVSDGKIVEPSSTETESAAVGEADNKDPAAAAHTTTTGTIPALPAPGQGDVEGDGSSRTLEVDGKAVALDHLGPMVVGRDGTVSRIANWDEMTEMERRNTLRVLCKRNQVRLAALRGKDGQGTGTTSS